MEASAFGFFLFVYWLSPFFVVDTYNIPPLTVSIFSTSIGLRRERYGGDIIHSLSPGFRVTQSLDVFFRNTKLHRYFDTLRLHLRLVRAFAESRCISLLFYPQQLAILFRLAVPHFSTGAYTLTLRCCSGRNWSKLVEIWGIRNEIDNKSPTERLHVTCRQLQHLTSNHNPRNRGTLLVGCVRASGATDSSRSQPGITDDVFREPEVESQHHQKTLKIAKRFISRAGA